MLTGQEKKGFIHRSVDSTDDMDTEIQKLATTLSQSNPEAMKELKKLCGQDQIAGTHC